MNPAVLFTAVLNSTALRFCGLSEVKQNATWENSNTPESEKALSDQLRALMHEANWSEGEPYCAAFVGAMVILAAEAAKMNSQRFIREWTPHCMTNVRRFRELNLLDAQPSDGAIVLMRHGSTDNGHAALCVRVEGIFPYRTLHTIEGNTMPGSEGNQRNGDGIFARTRNVFTNGDLKTQGFISARSILTLLDPL